MNRRDWYAPVLGGAALLALGFLLRGKPGERVVYREREGAKAEASRDAKAEQTVAASATQATTALAVNRKRARRLSLHTKPNGEQQLDLVEFDEAAVAAMAEQRAQELVAQARAEERQAARAEMARELDLRVREPELPRLSLGGGVTGDGLRPDGGYVSAGVRIVGPLWAKCQLARFDRETVRWSCGGEVQW